jgi:hypothetical protein
MGAEKKSEGEKEGWAHGIDGPEKMLGRGRKGRERGWALGRTGKGFGFVFFNPF